MFTQPCFIRKNTPEIRQKLEELGYKPCHQMAIHPNVYKNIAVCNFFGSNYYGVSEEEISRPGSIDDAIKNRGMIDCGENEFLFLALAALRDDKPDYQWFVWDDIEDEGEKFKQYIPGEPWQEWWWFEVHKATVEEIIKYFK
jgi:hypothetical protein